MLKSLPFTPTLLLAGLLISGCANPPRLSEEIWVSVVDIYTPEELQKSFNQELARRFSGLGYTAEDFAGGRLLRVACGLGTDYTWGSFAVLPRGLRTTKDSILRLRIEAPGDDNTMGINPVVGPVPEFRWPGSMRAYRFIPDWRERNLANNYERIPLAPEQQGRYVITHGAYVISCRQGMRG